MFYDKDITAAVQRNRALGGGTSFEPGNPSALLRDRMEVLRDEPELPMGIAREPLVHLAGRHIVDTDEHEVLIGPDPSREKLLLAWAIMANIPLHPGTRGQSSACLDLRSHFGWPDLRHQPEDESTSQSIADRRWWGELIGTIIGVDPTYLLDWLFRVRDRRAQTFNQLIAMNQWQAVEEDAGLLEERWPEKMHNPPRLLPLQALALFCEFVRIAQLQRAMLRWTFAAGKELTSDGLVKAFKNARSYKTSHPVVERLKSYSRLQTLAFGEPVNARISRHALRSRHLVAAASLITGGGRQAEFLRPRKPADALALAASFANHPRYCPSLAGETDPKKKQSETAKRSTDATKKQSETVRRSSAVTYWGLDYRDLPGVLLLDLWSEARRLIVGAKERHLGKVPAAVRDAIVEISLVWLEQENAEALEKQVNAVKAGGGEPVLPEDPEFRPSLGLGISETRMKRWKRLVSKLPDFGDDGALNRARPDLWIQRPSEEELLPFRAAQSDLQRGFSSFVPDHLCPPTAALAKLDRSGGYKAALRDVRELCGASFSLQTSADPVCAEAAANLSLVLSPLSLDPERDITKPSKRRLVKRSPSIRFCRSQACSTPRHLRAVRTAAPTPYRASQR